MMWKNQAGISMIFVCCALITFTGCKTKKPASGSSGNDIPPIGPISNGGDNSTLGSGPRPDAFEKGTRVADKFETVLFDFDSAQISPSEQPKIDAVVGFLKNNSDTVAILEGNCDERGSTEYNMSLGERRALAVRAAMIGAGVDAARLQTRSFGEEKPVDPGQNEDAWRKNRRVEFCIMR